MIYFSFYHLCKRGIFVPSDCLFKVWRRVLLYATFTRSQLRKDNECKNVTDSYDSYWCRIMKFLMFQFSWINRFLFEIVNYRFPTIINKSGHIYLLKLTTLNQLKKDRWLGEFMDSFNLELIFSKGKLNETSNHCTIHIINFFPLIFVVITKLAI